MPRNMSFALTTDQILARQKTVTRRFGWSFLKAGDRLVAVKKSMGLKKGEKIERLCEIEVVSNRAEKLKEITQEDVILEGFPDWTPKKFIEMLVSHHKVTPEHYCYRIEFKYV